MTAPRTLKRISTSPVAEDLGDVKGQVGYMMGKLESIEGQLAENNIQRQRMESKIDAIPSVIKESMAPMIESTKAHDARLAALEQSDAREQGGISAKTKLWAAVLGLFGLGSTATAIWEAFHPGK